MKMTPHEYIQMCTGIIDFYNLNKSMINGVDGLEGHFTDLHLMLIHLSNEHHRACGHLIPLYQEKEAIRQQLEDLLLKFNTALDRQAHDEPVKKGKRKKDTIGPPRAKHYSPTELIELYTTVNHKARNVSKDLLLLGITREDFNALDLLITQYVISLPVINMLKEKIHQTSRKENKIMSDMDYVIKKLIDPNMNFFNRMGTELYNDYMKVRDYTGEPDSVNGKNKDRRDAYLIA